MRVCIPLSRSNNKQSFILSSNSLVNILGESKFSVWCLEICRNKIWLNISSNDTLLVVARHCHVYRGWIVFSVVIYGFVNMSRNKFSRCLIIRTRNARYGIIIAL